MMAWTAPDADAGRSDANAKTGIADVGAVPAILITGFRDAAKLRFLDTLMLQRPASERWAVITPGLFPYNSPRPHPASDVEFATLAAACMCCIGWLPFRVGLIRLLRRMADAPANRLIIVAGHEHHAATLGERLRKPGFEQLLRLQTTVAVIDTSGLARMEIGSRAALRDLCAAADFIVLDPGEGDVASAGDAFSCIQASLAITTPMLGGSGGTLAECMGFAPVPPRG